MPATRSFASACLLAVTAIMAGGASAFSPVPISSTLHRHIAVAPLSNGISSAQARRWPGAAASLRMGANVPATDSPLAPIKKAIAPALASLTVLFGIANGLPAAFAISLIASSVGFVSAVYFVGYGYALSMTALGSLALRHFASGASQLAVYHASLVIAWGARIFAFLVYREFFAWTQLRNRNKETNKKFKFTAKVSTWLFVAVFYALLFSPALFHLQSASTIPSLTQTGLGVAAAGLLVESQSDSSKSAQKSASPEDFVSGGLYKIVRHPNYLGEVIFWVGSYMAGVGSFTTPLQWTSASLGLAGIIAIMAQATESLEKKQALRYQTKAGYKEYVANTPKLIPFTPGDNLSDIIKSAQIAVKKKAGAEAVAAAPAAVAAAPAAAATPAAASGSTAASSSPASGSTTASSSPASGAASVAQGKPAAPQENPPSGMGYSKNKKPWDV